MRTSLPIRSLLNKPALACLFSLFVLVLAGCASTTTAPASAPKANPHYKIGSPYRIGGRLYVPAADERYDEIGVASWYGPKFHGGLTANGEVFDMRALTAAHRTLPMPSIARVTNLANGKSINVRINDRGPFSKERIVDLSRKAAETLGFVEQGTTRVRVQYLGSAELNRALLKLGDQRAIAGLEAELGNAGQNRSVPPRRLARFQPDNTDAAALSDLIARTTGGGTALSGERYDVQIGSFRDPNRAEAIRLQAAAQGPAFKQSIDLPNGTRVHRVMLGPFSSEPEAGPYLQWARSAGFPGAWLVRTSLSAGAGS